MSELTRERIEDLMTSNPNIKTVGWIEPDKYGFCRTYQFEVRGVAYEIEWYCNYSELRCGEMLVLFDNFKIDNTWPHHFKNNLQFYRHGQVCCVIPIEEYEEEEKGGGVIKWKINISELKRDVFFMRIILRTKQTRRKSQVHLRKSGRNTE